MTTPTPSTATRLRDALEHPDASTRLQVALAAGTRPAPGQAEVLVARCRVEPDFFVRDMLTWALTTHGADVTVPLLLAELTTDVPQARSQALHTLSKIGDPRGWPAARDLLLDPDDEIARTAWRAAVALVPAGAEPDLAAVLVTQLGRGGRDVRRSLSRALAGLGEAAEPVLAPAVDHRDLEVRTHALVTLRLLHDPEADFDASVAEAQRTAALKDAPVVAPETGADR